ncbi:CD109 antigen [Lucilia cuprina]|nr:CD109 antigen [Lucilia cuprina]
MYNYYTIIAPGTIKSNRKYPVTVILHNADEPCTMRVTIEGLSFNETKDVYVNPLESKLIEFMPHKLSPGEYKLKAEGISGLIFKNESILNVQSDYGPHIYIQTDKAIYKPKDLVQFRVVILDEHTRPLKIKEPIRIEILDNLDNRVKQFKDISLQKGVYTGQFPLSEYPVLGLWKIKVIISGKYAYSHYKTITVQKYVLPKFSIHIKSPENILREDGSLKVGFYGKYTYDKYVAGYARIELWDNWNGKLLETKQLEVESVGFVEFHFDTTKDYKSFKIEVQFTENLTGIMQSEQRYVNIKNQRYNIRIPKEEIEFRNNKPYRLKAHVEHWSGAAVLDRETKVVMKHGNKLYESYLDGFGVASFDFDHKSMSDHLFTYKDSQEKFPNILSHDSLKLNETEYYCRLKLLGEGPRLGKTIEIEISSIEKIPYFVYTIMGHATIVHMELIKVAANQKSFIIRITPSIEMIPTSFIYVHYIQNGNLRYEELELKFPHEFENQISLAAATEVVPGKEVTIEIKAQPNSYVSILAVDLSVFLLDPSYDLKKHDILLELANDLSYTNKAVAIYPGIISGLITLTNAHYPYSSTLPGTEFRPASSFPPKFRSKFPETWIFQNLEIHDSSTQLTLQIPDTITTWRITAFSNNDIKGFGIVNEPTDITTIKPFFITLNLPYSVKRGEIVAIPIIIFNYHEQSLDTEIVMYNDNQEFYFMESNLQEAEKSEDDRKQIKQLLVSAEGGKTVTFYINPIQLGEIDLKISATNSLFTDAIVKKLKVEPEGVIKYHNKAMYLSVPPDETLSSFFFLLFPEEKVPDSEYITLSVGGDYLVPTLDNLQDLVHLPSGCGEQNMVNLAPNILILHYLKINGKLGKEKELVRKLRSFIDMGYQQQLSFRHTNGGYSVFGERSDREPSTWLTAYVVRFLIKSARIAPVEMRIIEKDLDYLANQQVPNGAFLRKGYLFSPTHQNQYGLTAFVLLSFLEDRKYALKYQNTIQKGLEFLNFYLNHIKDVYALSIVACALKMAKNNNADSVIEKLKQQSKTDVNGLMWWSGGDRNTANDVEITAYALMALVETPGDHSPILKWLIQQRNAQGGFKSTQDTVVGLQALVKFSEKYKNLNNVNLTVRYHAQDQEGIDIQYRDFKVEPDNALILQQHELPKSTRHISFEVKGTGQSLIQLSYQYNIIEVTQFRHFLINPKVKLLNPHELELEICFTYQMPSELTNSKTNMVIMEVNLPSGFRSDAATEFDIDDNESIQRIESKNSDSTIILYFDNLLANAENCLKVAADKISDVIKPKPAAIIVYDYYNLSRSNTQFYNCFVLSEKDGVIQFVAISVHLSDSERKELGSKMQVYYSINAPGVIKSNRKYSVFVALHDASEPCSIRIAIEGPSLNEFKDVNLKPYETQLIDFFPKKLLHGIYKLKAEGLSGLIFKNESTLNAYPEYGPKIYIQTDKAIYKPQDIVNFRVLILDEHTRPLNISDPVSIEILDAEKNHVKLFNNITLIHGVFTGHFKLSKYPLLGQWDIKAVLGGKYDYSDFKSITILDYVLPKFSVYLKTPTNVVLEDGYIKVVIFGKYTFDKHVEGNATVELWNDDVLLQTKHIDIENLSFVEFNIKNETNLNDTDTLKVKAKLTDKQTGRTEEEKKNINLHNQRYNIDIPYEEIEFENNKPYRLSVYVKHWSGAAVLDHTTPVIMEHGSKKYESFLDENGVATFEFEHDPNANHLFKFKDSKEELYNIYTSENLMLNNREYYCRLKLLDQKLKLGKPVQIEVSSIVNLPYLMYTIMGHASLIRTQHIKVPPNQKSHIITITPTIEMIPSSFIYVYYVHKGNLHYEEMLLRFPHEFENQITLSAPKKVKPGSEVTIAINAQPKSYVSILAVDLAVYLLDNSYDLDRNDILDELNHEISYTPIPALVYPGLTSGLVTLTNAHYPFEILTVRVSPVIQKPYSLRFRQKFPETWIFDNFLINETDTKLTFNIRMPITTWRINGIFKKNNDILGFWYKVMLPTKMESSILWIQSRELRTSNDDQHKELQRSSSMYSMLVLQKLKVEPEVSGRERNINHLLVSRALDSVPDSDYITFSCGVATDRKGTEVAKDVFRVNSNTLLDLHLPQSTRHITFEMEGNGASLVQLNHQYNILNVEEFHHFDIQPKTIFQNDEEMNLGICFTYHDDSNIQNEITTNMVIMEANLPSGFKTNAEKEMVLRENNIVQKIDSKNSESKIILYLDKLQSKSNHCLEIFADRTNEILMPKPAAIIMYDYYNLSRSNTKFYNKNRVKLFNNITLTHGVFTEHFKLSKYPILGQWDIKAVLGGRYDYFTYKAIHILDYTLPKFSVYLKTPSNIVLHDGYIKVVIFGKYTFDKHVEGNATVELLDGSVVIQTKHVVIESLGFVEFNIKNETKLNHTKTLKVKAKLTDKQTGRTEEEMKEINLHDQRYKIDIPYNEIEFENNKPYRLSVYVKHWSGAAVLDHNTPVIMEHGSKKYESFLDENGVATFEFEHDPNAHHLFKFKDSMAKLYNIYTSENLMLNNREYYCRLKLVDKILKIGKPVQIEVSSILNIPYLMYTLMSHASLIHTEHIKVPPNQKSNIITIMPSIEMIPRSYIYVYYVHKGKLHYEEMLLSFPLEFENQISLSAPKKVKPGENVTITINAQPKSYVGILAVDLGVYLLDNSYDLSRMDIINELSYEMSYTPLPWAMVYPGLTSGLVTLTNAHYPYELLTSISKPVFVRPYSLRFRQKFPETWIFDNFLINETDTKLTIQIPDTITTWRITAFSNNDILGFGIVNGPTDITTIQNFFISLNLPNSVKRGEIVTIPVTIYNYSNQTLDTEVMLHNKDGEFDFMESTIQGIEKSNDDQQQMKVITVPEDKAKTVKFIIYPIKTGEISFKVTASSSMYSDAVLQKLKVEPEGVPKQINQASYLSIPAGEKISSSFSIKEPLDSVPDSDYITFSVGGHYLVPTVENFNDLIQMPTGCANDKLTKEKGLVESLRSSIEVAYQQQLSFRHENGGYSVFGMETDEEPNTWLTAYVVRYFIKASQFISIETKVIDSALEYLSGQQKSNGEFPYTGYLLNPKHKNAYGLTAFILLAFLENEKYATQYAKNIQSGVEFLTSNLNNTQDIYALSLIATAIKRAKHPSARSLINKLNPLCKEHNGLKWWSANDQNLADDIEITSYSAMALLETPGDHTSILKWLIEQRNANGGFTSSYDTVVGMEALVKFSDVYKNLKNVNLKISYSAIDRNGTEVAKDLFRVNSNTLLDLHVIELPQSTRHITFEMDGNGASLVQLNHQYNILNVEEFQHFNIQPKTIFKNDEEMNLEVCFTYHDDSNIQNEITTNMVIMEANLPSGFKSNAEKDMILRENNIVQKIESKNSESTIILYLDKLQPNISHCLEIPAEKTSEILMAKPSAIIMYDYYNLTRSSTQFYSL